MCERLYELLTVDYPLNIDGVVPVTRLGWTRVGLLAGLIGQLDYLIYILVRSSVPTFLWFTILANAVAYLIVRRALRWRYPI